MRILTHFTLSYNFYCYRALWKYSISINQTKLAQPMSVIASIAGLPLLTLPLPVSPPEVKYHLPLSVFGSSAHRQQPHLCVCQCSAPQVIHKDVHCATQHSQNKRLDSSSLALPHLLFCSLRPPAPTSRETDAGRRS